MHYFVFPNSGTISFADFHANLIYSSHWGSSMWGMVKKKKTSLILLATLRNKQDANRWDYRMMGDGLGGALLSLLFSVGHQACNWIDFKIALFRATALFRCSDCEWEAEGEFSLSILQTHAKNDWEHKRGVGLHCGNVASEQ